ncbi:hypothetical protein [Algibacter luteus]|uniref:Cytochrome C and Quinol oxidase polypeptide I n=1 Tax=Algibacter luteus TaxID=1178825 RepID=A0A1M6FC27_9FLAO|nr:hypothetical protein [Algibacter luteus]SHI95227.1 hypothetical protein SAMN05216261_2310 [Algibacter luteus]
MEVHLKIIGVLLMALASIHVFFPKYFSWKEELKSLSLINRQMMTVHTFFIAFVVFLMGLLCLTSATDLTQTKFGRTIALGLGFFWATRLIFQLFVYSTKLWKGKTFETTIHIVFTIFWIYLTSVFLRTGLK